MTPFKLPAWKVGDIWRVGATLSYRRIGAFKVPKGPPDGPYDIVDTKIDRIETAWEYEVVEAPEDEAAEGAIALNLMSRCEPASPFGGQAFRIALRRARGPEGELRVGLESVRTLTMPQPKDAVKEGEARDLGTPGAAVVQADPARNYFDPALRTGFLFDLPCLSESVQPTATPVEVTAPGVTTYRELRAMFGGSVRFHWSHDFPAGPKIRSVQEWREGLPWYAEFRREREFLLEDGTNEAQPVAHVRLEGA